MPMPSVWLCWSSSWLWCSTSWILFSGLWSWLWPWFLWRIWSWTPCLWLWKSRILFSWLWPWIWSWILWIWKAEAEADALYGLMEDMVLDTVLMVMEI